MSRAIIIFAKFVISLMIITIFFTVVWELVVHEWLYDCTDAGMLGYWQPGDWIHGHYDTVSQVVHGRSMSEPDTIKEGWTMARLWFLWSSSVIISILLSAWAAMRPRAFVRTCL